MGFQGLLSLSADFCHPHGDEVVQNLVPLEVIAEDEKLALEGNAVRLVRAVVDEVVAGVTEQPLVVCDEPKFLYHNLIYNEKHT